jgi:uncharacterized RmlC-like cupin family protein
MSTALQAIRIVRPSEFDTGTAQTPGSVRRAAIAPQFGIDTVLWGGEFEVEPAARTGIHRHGEQETIAYVLSGSCEFVGAQEASTLCRPGLVTSSMCRPSCRTWRSIPRTPSPSAGSS